MGRKVIIFQLGDLRKTRRQHAADSLKNLRYAFDQLARPKLRAVKRPSENHHRHGDIEKKTLAPFWCRRRFGEDIGNVRVQVTPNRALVASWRETRSKANFN